jgi:hypothetical protein
MADQAGQWANVSDVDTLKAIVAAQQAQLAQLQTQKPAPAPASAAAGQHSDRKRKAVKLHDDECSDFEDNDKLGLDQGLQADDEEYDPTNDSDCEEPKKKKKQVLLLLKLSRSTVSDVESAQRASWQGEAAHMNWHTWK